MDPRLRRVMPLKSVRLRNQPQLRILFHLRDLINEIALTREAESAAVLNLGWFDAGNVVRAQAAALSSAT
jgi:hypothetical protein